MLMAALAALPPVNRALFATVTRLLKDVVRLTLPTRTRRASLCPWMGC
jgi:hypothetical protein